MKVLMIEDEEDFIGRVQTAFAGSGESTLLTNKEVGLDDSAFNREGGESIEDQLRDQLKKIVAEKEIDLVFLDTDLSREKGLRTQTEYRYAFRQIGLPVCRYRKRARQSAAQSLELSHKLAIDGATAIMVPHDIVTEDGPENDLVKWLTEIHLGFSKLSEAMSANPQILQDTPGPAGILASLLRKPSLHADLLGYTSQNSLFFGGTETASQVESEKTSLFSTRLGYWLVNYILAFPGPILHDGATAAFLNVTLDSLKNGKLREVIEPARYSGPFENLGGKHYWLEDLADLLERSGGDITRHEALKDERLERVDASPYGQAFYCIVSQKPIPASEAATSPDWIPSGARMTKIRQEDLDQLGPMLNI